MWVVQEFCWTEDSLCAAKAERGSSLSRDGLANIDREPMFCFEARFASEDKTLHATVLLGQHCLDSPGTAVISTARCLGCKGNKCRVVSSVSHRQTMHALVD